MGREKEDRLDDGLLWNGSTVEDLIEANNEIGSLLSATFVNVWIFLILIFSQKMPPSPNSGTSIHITPVKCG